MPIIEALEWQRDHVLATGAATAGLLLQAVIDDVARAGALARLMPEAVRFGDLVGLRVMATVHRLAIDRAAPEVALFLPTLGGTAPATAHARAEFARAVVAALLAHPDELQRMLLHTPQTNETGRAALLRLALSAEEPSRPVRLMEIGASAGLNLRADHLPGLPGLERGPLPPIVERLGCDLAPVDVDSIEGRSLLSSYVWVDDVERFRRLAAAMEVARRVPATVLPQDAEEFVAGLRLRPGTTAVLWHSAMWVYLPAPAREAILESIDEVGAAAGADAPFVHVSWEWDPESDQDAGFALVTRRWDGRSRGEPLLLARGRSHGGGVIPQRAP